MRASPIGLSTDIALHPTLDGPWTHHFVQLGEVRLHYVEAGPASGPLVILLHGFPDFWLAWRRQIPALAEAGLRVVAPDLRGFNLSDKPRSVSDYSLSKVADDIAALIRHFGAERASIVGHDIGGAVTWKLARRRPELVERIVAISAPPSKAMMHALRRPAQMRRSWYMLFFALPWLPERVLGARRAAMIGRVFRQSAIREGAFEDEEIDALRDAASRPDALRSMMHYYRAMLRGAFSPVGSIAAVASGNRMTVGRAGRMTRPALVIWGDEEPFLDHAMLDDAASWGADVRVHRVPRAGHWVMADAPTEVNRSLVAFLKPSSQA